MKPHQTVLQHDENETLQAPQLEVDERGRLISGRWEVCCSSLPNRYCPLILDGPVQMSTSGDRKVQATAQVEVHVRRQESTNYSLSRGPQRCHLCSLATRHGQNMPRVKVFERQ